MSEVKKEIKPSRKGDIVKVVLAILAVLMGTYMFVDPGKQILQVDPTVVKTIDSLENENANLQRQNQRLDSILTDYSEIIAHLDWRLTTMMKEKYKDVKQRYEDKSEEIADDGPNELDSFFINRYSFPEEPNE